MEIQIPVNAFDAQYLLQALQAEMPLRPEDSLSLRGPNTFVWDDDPRIILTVQEPLTLEQRRWLMAHGLFIAGC